MSLHGKTLVLNRSWMAVAVTDIRGALTLLYTDRARAICPDSYQVFDWRDWVERRISEGALVVHGVMLTIQQPEVLLLRRYSGAPFSGPAFSRRAVQRRDRFTCQYCGARPALEDLTIDHIVPRCHGGPTSWENCVSACHRCNRIKGDRRPDTAGMKLLCVPKKPRWMLPGLQSSSQLRKSWSNFLAPQGLAI